MAFYLININFINILYTFKIWSTLKVHIQYNQVLLFTRESMCERLHKYKCVAKVQGLENVWNFVG